MLIRDGDFEKELTLQAMRAFGVDFVRGGPYTRITPPKKLRSFIDETYSCIEKENLTNMAVNMLQQSNLNDWCVSDALKNKYNSSEFHIYTKNTKAHPRVQLVSNKLPMRCPFGVSQFNDQGTLSINFCVAPYNEDVKLFLQGVDRFVLDWCWENKQAVFGNKLPPSREVF